MSVQEQQQLAADFRQLIADAPSPAELLRIQDELQYTSFPVEVRGELDGLIAEKISTMNMEAAGPQVERFVRMSRAGVKTLATN